MQADDPFESPMLLLKFTEITLSDFDAACAEFCSNSHYDVVKRSDRSGRIEFYCRFSKAETSRLRILAYRAITDLRHALDQTFCAAAKIGGCNNVKRLYFPFGRTRRDMENQIADRCKNVDAMLLDFVRQCEPYEGGNEALYSLATLSGAAKHQKLITVTRSAEGFILDGSQFSVIQGPATLGSSVWNPSRDELKILTIEPGGLFEGNIKDALKPRLHVVLGTGEPPLSGPAPAALRALSEVVQRVVAGMVEEATRIALVHTPRPPSPLK
ncbi:hypothetical protein [Roseomonas sp. AR75]|uniref:hypothetical protein n=1 Tax=Roseomonas sp. AR75 TaxID=2562311 RepID=UPI0010C020D4|nr:hypothetical protein [Roseomonas sp. AR75]